MTVYREPRRHLFLWRNSPVDCSSSFGRYSLLCISSVSDQLYSQQVVFWEVTAWPRAGAMETRLPVGAGARRGSLGPLSRRRRAGTKPETLSLQQVGCVGSAQAGGNECRRAEEPRPPPRTLDAAPGHEQRRGGPGPDGEGSAAAPASRRRRGSSRRLKGRLGPGSWGQELHRRARRMRVLPARAR